MAISLHATRHPMPEKYNHIENFCQFGLRLTNQRNAKNLRFTPPILPPVRTLVPIFQRRMAHSTGSLHYSRASGVGHHDRQKPADASSIPKFARSSCRTTDGASHPKTMCDYFGCSQFLDSCFASQLIWYESKTGRILAVLFVRGWL
jgi:hypothetical protein